MQHEGRTYDLGIREWRLLVEIIVKVDAREYVVSELALVDLPVIVTNVVFNLRLLLGYRFSEPGLQSISTFTNTLQPMQSKNQCLFTLMNIYRDVLLQWELIEPIWCERDRDQVIAHRPNTVVQFKPFGITWCTLVVPIERESEPTGQDDAQCHALR
jgi:hypothetical protein